MFRDMQRFIPNSARFLVVRKNKQTDKQTNKQTSETLLCRQFGPALKVPSLACSVPKPLSIFAVDRMTPDGSFTSLSTPYQPVVNDDNDDDDDDESESVGQLLK